MTDGQQPRPELLVTVRVVARRGGIFEATAGCELGGATFEGKGVDANASAPIAIAQAVANLVQGMSARYERFKSFGGDVVLKEDSQRVAEALDALFKPDGLPPIGGKPTLRLEGTFRHQADVVVTGDLVDDDDDER